MKKIDFLRTYEGISATTNYVLFEKKNRKFKLCVNKDGYFFTDGCISDYICIYDDFKFASDYTDRLPKYILNYFAKLLETYGKEALKEYQRNLI